MTGGDIRYRLARLIAWFSWLVVGGTELVQLAGSSALQGNTARAIWFAAYAAFALALYMPRLPGERRASRASHLVRLGLATASAMTMVAVDPRSFACALVVIVAWELAIALPMTIVLPWVVVQTVLVAGLLVHGLPAAFVFPEVAIYLAFQGYALLTASVARSEADARAGLARANRELEVAQLMLTQRVRLEERLRLSRELHDLIGHHLSALVMHLEIARHSLGTGSEASVVKSQDIARQLLADVRNVVRLTRSEDGLDLSDLLKEVVDDIPNLQVHLSVADNARPTGTERARMIVRVVQEAATNALRHSGASNLWIELARSGSEIRISARDDGKGAAELVWGNGLRGMRERLAEFGGSLAIETDAHPGFRLTALVPLDEVRP